MQAKNKPSDLVEQAIQSDEKLKTYAERIFNGVSSLGEDFSKKIVESIKKVISNKSVLPEQKVRALKLVQRCMESLIFAVKVQKNLLKKLKEFALYKKADKNINRGVDIFGTLSLASEENQKASILFHKTLLYYIEYWASKYQVLEYKNSPSEFYLLYHKLRKENVVFPQAEHSIPNPSIVIQKSQSSLSMAYQIMAGGNPEAFQDMKQSLIISKREIESVLASPQPPDVMQILLDLNDQISQIINQNPAPQVPARIDKDRERNIFLQKVMENMTLENKIRESEISIIQSENDELRAKLSHYETPKVEKIELYRPLCVYDYPEDPFESSNSSEESGELLNTDLIGISRVKSFETLEGSFLQFRACTCGDSEVLFDNPKLQVRIHVYFEYSNLNARLEIQNKTNEDWKNIEHRIIDYQEEKLAVLTNDQVQSIAAEDTASLVLAVSFYQLVAKYPIFELNLPFSSLRLKLPLSVMRFCKSRKKSGSTVYAEWNQLAGKQRLGTIELKNIGSLRDLALCLGQNGNFKVYTSDDIPDLSASELISGGRIFNDTVFIRASMEAKATLEVRSSDDQVRNAIFELMHELLTGIWIIN